MGDIDIKLSAFYYEIATSYSKFNFLNNVQESLR